MIRLLTLLVLMFLVIPTCFGRSLKFEHKNHNFGDVIRGEILSWQVKFENTGKQEVRIQGVYSGCGCTAVELDQEKIYRPGQKGRILVKFDTSNFVGKVSKQIIVISSEKKKSQTNLNVKANIKEEFRIDPVLVDFGVVDEDSKKEKQLVVKPTGDFQLTVKDIEYNEDRFELTSTKEDDQWNLHIRLKKGMGSGFIKDTIYIITNSDVLPKVKIPVRVEVRNLIELTPNYIEFGVIKKKQNVSKKIKLKSLKKFKLVAAIPKLLINNQLVDNADEIIKVELPESLSKSKSLGITISNSTALTGSIHGRILLESSLGSHKNIEVDFYAFFK